jgi:hypothetical protein
MTKPMDSNKTAAIAGSLAGLVLLGTLIISVRAGDKQAAARAQVQVGRFQIISSGSNAAVDTATGKMCWLYDPLGQGSEKIPLCSSLVK